MWCRSAVNRIFLSLLAACRTRSSALGAPCRLSVRGAFWCCRFPGVVRPLHRYYRPVRLPVPVHRRRTSLDFPTRPAVPSSASEHGTSRFSCEVFPYVLGVSARAGPCCISRYRCNGYSLPLTSTASASRRKVVSRLNTQPARAPVNASMPPSQAAPHDSGPVWVASPSPYDSFIHDTSPVYPGAQKFHHVTPAIADRG